jgi:hypothetical protein
MINKICEIAIPFIMSIILTYIAFKIKRNRANVFYIEFSQLNLGISIFLSLVVLIPFWQNKGRLILIFLLGIILFSFFNSFFTYYKIESDQLIIKKNIFSRKIYININEIVSIDTSIDLPTDISSYKIVMNNNVSIQIQRDIENINNFFLKLKNINDTIILPKLELRDNLLKILDIIIRIIIPIVFYTAGIGYVMKKILQIYWG